jgi:hypothetical protein
MYFKTFLLSIFNNTQIGSLEFFKEKLASFACEKFESAEYAYDLVKDND